MKSRIYPKLALFLAIVFIIRFYLSTLQFNRDMVNHMVWSKSMIEEGLKGLYLRNYSPWAQANYPPLANLLFLASHKIYLAFNINSPTRDVLAVFYKIPLLIADIVMAVLLFKLGYKKLNLQKGLIFLLLFITSVGLIYNSVFWGQIENLMTMFCLLSLLFFYKKEKILAFIFYVLALLVKQSALFFAPVFLTLVLKKTSLKEKLLGFILFYILFVFSFSFFIDKDYLTYPFLFYFENVQGQQPWVSVNAFNFWFLLGLNKVSDSQLWLNLSYQKWSVILMALINLPVLMVFFLKPVLRRAIYVTAILSLTSFLFLTRMHERHFYPALVFLIPLIISFKKTIFYIVLSLIHFLNLYLVWGEYLAQPTDKTLLIGKVLSLFSLLIFSYYYLNYWLNLNKDKL